jgi:hypothetical protein
LNGRLFEWFAALNMVGIGFTIVLWPETLNQTAFRFLLTLFITPSMVGLTFFAIGCARIAALVVNGRSWIYGPRIRAWSALFSAILWLQLWLGSLQFSFLVIHVPTIGICNWACFFAAELIISYRAATDVRNN